MAELRAVARDVVADPRLADPEAAPDPAARQRFERLVRQSRGE